VKGVSECKVYFIHRVYIITEYALIPVHILSKASGHGLPVCVAGVEEHLVGVMVDVNMGEGK
jgi:hypothetical protein